MPVSDCVACERRFETDGNDTLRNFAVPMGLNAMFFYSVRDKRLIMISLSDTTCQCEDMSITLCLRLCETTGLAGCSRKSENLFDLA